MKIFIQIVMKVFKTWTIYLVIVYIIRFSMHKGKRQPLRLSSIFGNIGSWYFHTISTAILVYILSKRGLGYVVYLGEL